MSLKRRDEVVLKSLRIDHTHYTHAQLTIQKTTKNMPNTVAQLGSLGPDDKVNLGPYNN